VIRIEMKALQAQVRAAQPSVIAEAQRQQAEREYERRWFEAEAKVNLAIAEGKKQAEIDSLKAESAQIRKEQSAARVQFQADLRGGHGIPTPKQLERAATDILQDTAVGKVDPQRFWAAARKASREAIIATSKQEPEKALAHKGRELLNLELYRQAADIKAGLVKTRVDWLKMFRSDEKLQTSRVMDMVNAARAIASRYLFPDKKARVDQALALLKEYDVERWQDVIDSLPEIMYDGRGLKDLTVSEFNGVRAVVDELWKSAKREKQILIEGKLVANEAARDSMRVQMAQFKDGWNKFRAEFGDRTWSEWMIGKLAVARRILGAGDGRRSGGAVANLLLESN